MKKKKDIDIVITKLLYLCSGTGNRHGRGVAQVRIYPTTELIFKKLCDLHTGEERHAQYNIEPIRLKNKRDGCTGIFIKMEMF